MKSNDQIRKLELSDVRRLFIFQVSFTIRAAKAILGIRYDGRNNNNNSRRTNIINIDQV